MTGIESDSDSGLDQYQPSGLTTSKKQALTPKKAHRLTDATNDTDNAASVTADTSPPPRDADEEVATKNVVTPNAEIEVPSDTLERFLKSLGGEPFSSGEAKNVFFLETDDLRGVRYTSVGGGIGCGAPTKIYRSCDLVPVALEKHSQDGLKKKLEARYRREKKKRIREIEAKEAAVQQEQERLRAQKKQKTGDKTVASSGGDSTEIKKLRASLLRIAKKNLGFEMSGSPKSWRFQVPGTMPPTFAALMGRPLDTELATFVKRGAYYSETMDASELFGQSSSDSDQLMKFFSREGVGQRIGENVMVRFKPSTSELSVSGWAEICAH